MENKKIIELSPDIQGIKVPLDRPRIYEVWGYYKGEEKKKYGLRVSKRKKIDLITNCFNK